MPIVPLTTTDFDLSNVSFISPVKEEVKTNGQPVTYFKSYATYKGEKGVFIQTPKLGLKNITETHMEMLLSRKQKQKLFYNLIASLENFTIEETTNKSYEWFKKELSHDQVFNMFKSSLLNPLFMDAAFTFKVPIDSSLDIEDPGPANVMAILKIEGVIFSKTSCNLDMKVVQTKFSKATAKPLENELVEDELKVIDSHTFFEGKGGDDGFVNEENELNVVDELVKELDELDRLESEQKVEENKVIQNGTKIESQYFPDGEWFQSTVTGYNDDGSYSVIYDDGTVQENLNVQFIRTGEYSEKDEVSENDEVPEKVEKVVEVPEKVEKVVVPEQILPPVQEKGEEKEEEKEELVVYKEKGIKKDSQFITIDDPVSKKDESNDIQVSTKNERVNKIKKMIQKAIDNGDVEQAIKFNDLLKSL